MSASADPDADNAQTGLKQKKMEWLKNLQESHMKKKEISQTIE